MHKKPPQHKKTASRIDRKSRGLSRKPTSINELLAGRPLLQALAATTAPQDQWRAWLAAELPPELAGHLVSVVLKPPELVVFADGAAWAARLRYGLATLDGKIRARDALFTRCVVRVMPRQQSTRQRQPTR